MDTNRPTERISVGIANLLNQKKIGRGGYPQIFSLDRYNAVYDNICTPIRCRFDADDNTFLISII